MKIARVLVHPLRLPLPRPLRTSIHDIRSVDTVLVELQGDGGAVGTGYGFVFGDRRARALQALVEDLAPVYEGQEATATRTLFDHAWRSINFLGHAGSPSWRWPRSTRPAGTWPPRPPGYPCGVSSVPPATACPPTPPVASGSTARWTSW